VALEAEHFTRRVDRAGAGWHVIPGLGRTGDSVAIFPTTAPGVDAAQTPARAPLLEYRLHLFSAGRLTVTCYLVPTQPVRGDALRYGVGFDDEAPQVVRVAAEVSSKEWAQNVLNATTTATTTHEVAAAGAHVLRLYMVDPGVVLDKIVIDAGGLRASYLGPPETSVVDK
jgi:hypothetical protein